MWPRNLLRTGVYSLLLSLVTLRDLKVMWLAVRCEEGGFRRVGAMQLVRGPSGWGGIARRPSISAVSLLLRKAVLLPFGPFTFSRISRAAHLRSPASLPLPQPATSPHSFLLSCVWFHSIHLNIYTLSLCLLVIPSEWRRRLVSDHSFFLSTLCTMRAASTTVSSLFRHRLHTAPVVALW